MEPLSHQVETVNEKFQNLDELFRKPIPTRRSLRPPVGVSEVSAMYYVRAETYFGGYISQENGRPPAHIRAQFRQWIKDGVLNITPEEAHEDHQKGQKLRAYYEKLQRELEYFEGPFVWKYGHEKLKG